MGGRAEARDTKVMALLPPVGLAPSRVGLAPSLWLIAENCELPAFLAGGANLYPAFGGRQALALRSALILRQRMASLAPIQRSDDCMLPNRQKGPS